MVVRSLSSPRNLFLTRLPLLLHQVTSIAVPSPETVRLGNDTHVEAALPAVL